MREILVSGNRAYFPHLLFLALSLRETEQAPFALHLLTGDFRKDEPRYAPFEEVDRLFLERFLKAKNPANEVYRHDLTMAVLKTDPRMVTHSRKYTPYAFLRLFVDGLPLTSEKPLYLDLDLVAERDLGPLFATDLKGYDYALAADPVATFWFHRSYANSGVLLYSLPALKAHRTLEKMRARFVQKPCLDQKLLNDQPFLFLSEKYNEQKATKEETVLRHYPGYPRFFPFPHYETIRPADEAAFKKKYPLVYAHWFPLFEETLAAYRSFVAK
jgi:lipopolysaccharide biosynthesis glycosyltransferase